MSDKDRLMISFPDKVEMFVFNDDGNVTGLNREHGFLFGRTDKDVGTLLSYMTGILDFDLTRSGTENRGTQERLGKLINELLPDEDN